MNGKQIITLSKELGVKEIQINAVANLLEQGATIPFISRYRKEATGGLDEIAITSIRDRLKYLEELDGRRETILNSLEKHGHLTDELKKRVQAAQTHSALEDIYLPFRPKRRTKATIAKNKGLEPLALELFEQRGINPTEAATTFVDAQKGVDTVEDALSGARHIIAEIINEDTQARVLLRNLYAEKAVFKSRVASGMEQEGTKYKDYFHWEEPASAAPSHRVLAMRRGEKEDILNLTLAPPEDEAVKLLEDLFIKGNGLDSDQVKMAVSDSYKRLLSRAMETELRIATKERADTEAIRVFADNLRQLLLAPPLGGSRVMGIDPGFRTGCKVVCLDRQGKLLHNNTIYPHLSEKQAEHAGNTVKSLCERFDIEAIAVGNGTGGRETEALLKKMSLGKNIPILLVNESGASVYSASEVAREEFPNHDITVRGAVSIGRRLMDPLAELVKIDPKSIGVGQYQHDVDPSSLRQALDDVVMSCVNSVGVDVNRASIQLLTYVSGIGPGIAKNIVQYRDENGAYASRDDLKNVPRLGPKAFQQSSGFLRIKNGTNPLDASAVHPESYGIVFSMAQDLGCTVTDLMSNPQLRNEIDILKYVTDRVGIPTLKDIMEELAKPGRDPRDKFEAIVFASGIEKIGDLESGQRLPGIVTNVTAFGAFVDIGVHQDGLVHISELSDRFVKNPAQVVKIHQKVMVTVLDVDLERKRIRLSMKSNPDEKPKIRSKQEKTKPESRIRGKKVKKKPLPFNNPFTDIFKRMS
ncbi:MAG: Tex family protein [Desulfobacterales bacterium]|jgi:uncharacterized protein